MGRLEAEIRFVVEGRQRAEQRLSSLEQTRSGQHRWTPTRPGRNGLGLAEQIRPPGRRTAGAQVEEQAMNLPTAGGDAPRVLANEQRRRGAQVQQQIQVLAAEQRVDRGAVPRQASPRLVRTAAGDRSSLPTDRRTWKSMLERRQLPRELAEARCTSWPSRTCRCWKTSAASGSRTVKPELARQAELSAAGCPAKALQEKVQTEGKPKPWLAKHGWMACRPVDQGCHIEQGWENRAGGRCVSAWALRWRVRLDTGARLCQATAAARLAFQPAAPRPRRPSPTRTAAPAPTCCAERRWPAEGGCSPTG